MLRILKDTVLCGVPVHAGETFPAVDIPESDLSVIIGAGYAERFTPEVKTPDPEIELETSASEAEQTPALEEPSSHAKKARKRKK
jgi:hypothetical protein